MNATEMLNTHPDAGKIDASLLAACIEHCYTCAQKCSTCADACLAEEQVGMLARCIRMDLDCADLCLVTGRVLGRQGELPGPPTRELVQACMSMCSMCADECEQHAGQHRHCALCMEACRDCARACRHVLEALV